MGAWGVIYHATVNKGHISITNNNDDGNSNTYYWARGIQELMATIPASELCVRFSEYLKRSFQWATASAVIAEL